MAVDPGSFEDIEGTRSDYDWGSAKPLGEDAIDYSDDPRMSVGAGYITPDGYNEIVELARDSKWSNDLYVYVSTPARRNSPSGPMHVRAKNLLERDNAGSITILEPEQFQAEWDRDKEIRERIANGEESLGATWFDGRLVDVRQEDEP